MPIEVAIGMLLMGVAGLWITASPFVLLAYIIGRCR